MPIGKTLSAAGRSASSASSSASSSADQVVLSGWLIKSPPEKTIWRHKWKKTWFVLRAGNYPGQYLLEYFKQKSDKKPRGTIDLSQCEQVDAGLVFESRKVDFPFIFDIKTKDRTYYLVTQTEEEMNEWVKNICSLCGFKVKDEGENVGAPPLDPSAGRPVSTPTTFPRRPPSEPLVNVNNNNNNNSAPVNSHTLSHSHHQQQQQPPPVFHHTIASASRRASSPTVAASSSTPSSRSRHVSNASTATAFSSVSSDLNGFPSRSESSSRHPPPCEEDEERGPYIPLIECVSGRGGGGGAGGSQSADGSVSRRPSTTSSTWHPHQLPRYPSRDRSSALTSDIDDNDDNDNGVYKSGGDDDDDNDVDDDVVNNDN